MADTTTRHKQPFDPIPLKRWCQRAVSFPKVAAWLFVVVGLPVAGWMNDAPRSLMLSMIVFSLTMLWVLLMVFEETYKDWKRHEVSVYLATRWQEDAPEDTC